jgi:two-component system, cell cycle sensor histidine kinase and response regulator CckA
MSAGKQYGSKAASRPGGEGEMESIANGELRSNGGETIMLVEDEAFVRGVTQAVLESAGYSVVAVRDATEAHNTYEQHTGPIDLLLTDIVLPGEDGRRLGRRLSQKNSAMQILLVTGYLEEMNVHDPQKQDTQKEEGESLLRKPFAASTLLHMVRQLLDRRARPGRANDDVQASLR